ncbi:hypothetical protein BXZ70DRAFT_545403 [Cristinia sonorae]|uniref:Uncharacterized protein n=1 Tax=Cristinia sonorae TaxID=1940300 RepID=A0A8K0XL38_9AGAR|nr:hypothetical protein BXZ70DRAFT_545403 [Cristinia sonorae]
MPAAAALNNRPRSPALSLHDFHHLVTTAFDLHPSRPSSPAFTRVPPPLSRANSALSAVYPSPHDTSGTPSGDAGTSPLDSRPATSQSHLPHDFPAQRARTPFGLFKALKSRASAFLRPSGSDPAASQSSNPNSRPSTARPSISSQRTLQPFPYAPPPNLISSDSSSPCPPDSHPLYTAPSRVRTRSLPKSFLTMSPHGIHPAPPLPTTKSFLDLTSTDDRKERVPRPTPPPQVQVHAHLPPLRKSRSFAPSIFTKKLKRSTSKPADRPVLSRTVSAYGLRSSCDVQASLFDDPRCPSPFTSPREPPLPPHVAPDILAQRRGSATSSCTMSSTKTSSTLSDRVSSAFSVPISFPFISKSRSRSKLHLSIPSSTQSSPSSVSTAMTSPPVTPVSPTFAFGGRAGSFCNEGEYATSIRIDPNASRTSLHYFETEEEALAIGRVLTPEPDPFAKPDIEVDWDRDCERDATPRPISAQSRRSGLRRKRGSAASRSGVSIAIPEEQVDLTPCTPPTVSYADISPTWTFPSSCSIVPPPPCLKATPPSPTKSANPHPPSAWSPHCSPLMKPSLGVLEPAAGVDVLKALPPRPTSRPLPGIPSDMAEGSSPGAVVFTTPPRTGRLRRERRSINSFFSSPPSSPSSLTSAIPTNTPPRLPTRASDSSAQVSNKSMYDRPSSPFPLVRDLSGGSRSLRHASSSAGEDGTGAVDDRDDSCVLSEEFLRSLRVEPKKSALRLSVEDLQGRIEEALPQELRSDTPVYLDDETISNDNDGNTSRSTAFFSARSSLLSATFEEDNEADDAASRAALADYNIGFTQTPELEYCGGKSYF